MSTRGLMGFRIDGVEKLSFNHWDSYPSGLGADMLKDYRCMAKDWTTRKLNKLARDLVVLNDDTISKSTEEICDKNIGKFADTLEGGYIYDASGFRRDGLFCEWAYIIDLNEKTLEVYISGDPLVTFDLTENLTVDQFVNKTDQLAREYWG